MDIQDFWEKALKDTEIIRSRVQPLAVFGATRLPYIFLAESAVNAGDTVVRKGEVVVDKPSLILPSNLPQFEGFEPESEKTPALNPDFLATYLFVRGIRFPSLKYENRTHALDLREGRLAEAIRYYAHELEKAENVSTGLVIGPEDCWQFSLLIFIANQVVRQADGDIRKLLDDFKKKGPPF